MSYINPNFLNFLYEIDYIPYRYVYIFCITLYVFILTQEFNSDKRQYDDYMLLDRVSTMKMTEQIYQFHSFLILGIFYGSLYFEPADKFWGLTSLNLTIINILVIFFLLAIMNLSHNYNQSIGNIRSKIIKYSYYLTISLIFCNHLFLLFILLEIYTVLFLLYLIGFRHEMQEILYYLQHDLTTYVFTSLLSTVFFIIGIYFIIKDFGISALYLNELKLLYESSLDYQNINENVRGMCLILIAIFIKIGLAPFQGWTVRFFKRTCYQSLVYILLISKLILIFGAFFTLLPVFVHVTFILKFIGIFGLISYILGSYLIYLRHSESDKFLAYVNLTSSGFFFFIFFINNPQNYNCAFIYFSCFMVLMNYTLLSFYSTMTNWIFDFGCNLDQIVEKYEIKKSFFLAQGVYFNTYDKIYTNGYLNLSQNDLAKIIIHSVLASLPPTVTFFCKLFYDFSFFNKFSDITSPYGLIVVLSMLTYIGTVYGFIAIWKEIHLKHGTMLTFEIFRANIQTIALNYEKLFYIKFYQRYGYLIFFSLGFIFSDFYII